MMLAYSRIIFLYITLPTMTKCLKLFERDKYRFVYAKQRYV